MLTTACITERNDMSFLKEVAFVTFREEPLGGFLAPLTYFTAICNQKIGD